MRMMAPPAELFAGGYRQDENTEKYEHREDNLVHRASEQPLSTFSIDVDTGSYANVRRMLRQGVRPPADSVRAEEFINYFSYGHPAPQSREAPFRVSTELAPAPWNAKRQLLMVGIRVRRAQGHLAAVQPGFLIDTSGSMDEPNKLPLLKQAFAQLAPQLRAQDRVSIVVYAGSAGLVLPPTPGDRHGEILAALEQLQAGGSTNGGEGIQLAYAMAKQGFRQGRREPGDPGHRWRLQRRHQRPQRRWKPGRRPAQVRRGAGARSASATATTTTRYMAERLADVGDGNHAYIDTCGKRARCWSTRCSRPC